jgi:hypothetical protein
MQALIISSWVVLAVSVWRAYKYALTNSHEEMQI